MSAKDLTVKSKDIDRSKYSEDKLAKMKERFPDVDNDTLARYLIARNNKMKNAIPLLQGADAWRSVWRPILKEDCINEIMKGKIYVRGVDKEGRPLLIIRARFHDPKNRTIDEMAKMVMWWTEQVISRLPDDKSKYTILLDRSDAGISNQDLEFMRCFSQLFQRLYPERLNRAIVYPSSVVFWTVWNIAKLFLDPVTRNKVCPCMYFYGVQEWIADEHIPANMGGKSTYEFNHEEYSDPYPAEVLAKAKAEREQGRMPQGSMFTEQDAQQSSIPESGDNDDDDDA